MRRRERHRHCSRFPGNVLQSAACCNSFHKQTAYVLSNAISCDYCASKYVHDTLTLFVACQHDVDDDKKPGNMRNMRRAYAKYATCAQKLRPIHPRSNGHSAPTQQNIDAKLSKAGVTSLSQWLVDTENSTFVCANKKKAKNAHELNTTMLWLMINYMRLLKLPINRTAHRRTTGEDETMKRDRIACGCGRAKGSSSTHHLRKPHYRKNKMQPVPEMAGRNKKIQSKHNHRARTGSGNVVRACSIGQARSAENSFSS